MGKKTYIGVSSKARKVKKAYIGIDGKAHKIKKMYIGVNGKAQCIFSGGELKKYSGSITSLSIARQSSASIAIGNYAIIASGTTSTSNGVVGSSSADVYNSSLTKQDNITTNHHGSHPGSALVGNYGLIAGGAPGGSQAGASTVSSVDAYNASLTRSTPESLCVGRYYPAGATVGNYAVFAGGLGNGTGNFREEADAYNASLTRTTPSTLSKATSYMASASVGDYALFGGGSTTGSSTAKVETYNTSLTRGLVTDNLVYARNYMASTSVGDYAIFGGGDTVNANVVYAYDASLTRRQLGNLTVPSEQQRVYIGATTVKDYALFAGGRHNNSTLFATVDVYDSSLTKSVTTDFDIPRYFNWNHTAVSVGDYAIFAGGSERMTNTSGNYSSNITSRVEAYVVS